ncbi:MAG: glutathionylspermidine synthase family protein [Armatimonadetes bacterium]|nr:glutathionylspermidine synthase family protein [Armatimonadota bacterium]
MRRIPIAPRPNWQAKVEEWGLVFHTDEDLVYWNESAYYEFTAREIDELETATNKLHAMCLEAIDHVITEKRYDLFGFSPKVIQAIEWSWEAEPPTLYGRFDFVYDGFHPPKLLEYNADTPTALLEAAVIQWKWLQDLFPHRDQFNSIWEGLVEQWTWLKTNRKLLGSQIHFGHGDLWEDELTVAVLRDTAQEAGLATVSLLMENIGWDHARQWFADENNMKIWTIFKLYPWEWMVKEQFGDLALDNLKDTQWIEPVWKMVLSNKALMALLYELFPSSPYLLPAYLDGPRSMRRYVEKAILGREGANVTIYDGGSVVESRGGDYAASGSLFQEYVEIPNFDGNHPIIGSWIVGEDARGIGIRETDGLITDNMARFVPHLF